MSFRPSLLPLLLLWVALLVGTCMLPVRAWTWEPDDMKYGPCVWFKYVPQCPQGPSCADMGAPSRPSLPSDGQASPVDFAGAGITNRRAPVNTTGAIANSVCVKRIFPLIQPVDPVTGEELVGDDDIETTSSTVRLETDGGGVAVARCRPNDPLFLELARCGEPPAMTRVVSAGKASAAPSAEAPSMDFGLAGIYEVVAIYFYNGVLHRWDSDDGEDFPVPASDFEVEVHMRKAKLATADTQREDAYISQCFDYTKNRDGPDVILSLVLQPSSTSNVVNISVLTRLVDAIGFAAEQLREGSGSVVQLADDLPFFPFEAVRSQGRSEAGRQRAFGAATPNPIVVYTGSDVTLPCPQNIPRIVLSKPLLVPTAVSFVFASASKQNAEGMEVLTFPLDESTTITQTSLFQVVHEALSGQEENPDTDSDPGSTRGSTHPAITALAVVNCVLAFYLLLLIFARLEWIEWPTFLGGLNHPVQFYAVALGLETRLPADMQGEAEGRRTGAPADSSDDGDAGENSDDGDISGAMYSNSSSSGDDDNDDSSRIPQDFDAAEKPAEGYHTSGWAQSGLPKTAAPVGPSAHPDTRWATSGQAARPGGTRAAAAWPGNAQPTDVAGIVVSDQSDKEDENGNNRSVGAIVRRRR